MTAAGRLRERVTIQSPPAVDDGSGGQTGAWTNIATNVPAEVIALGGDEQVEAAIVTGITRYRVRLRKRAVTIGQRLIWEALQLDIRGVLPMQPDRGWVTLLCEGRAL